MENNAKVSGILAIIGGALGILGALMIILMAALMGYLAGGTMGYSSPELPAEFFTMMFAMYGVMGLCMIILGVIAIIGGVYSLKRKNWGFALAGAICSTIVFFPCGLAAIIFVVMARSEFKKAALPAPGV